MRDHSTKKNTTTHAVSGVAHEPASIGWSRLLVAGLIVVFVVGCGGDGDSSSGGGGGTPAPAAPASGDPGTVPPKGGANTPSNPPTTPATTVVGPNLNGQWSGYYKSINGNLDYLTATIVHNGRQVTITTSRPAGIVRELKGTIDAVGRMLLYDSFDHEDWTTLYGPASRNSINLADFVKVNNDLVDTNILILKR